MHSSHHDVLCAALCAVCRGERLKLKDLAAAMAAMDTDESGRIELEEFQQWWADNGESANKPYMYSTLPPRANNAEEACSSIDVASLCCVAFYSGGDLEKRRQCALTVQAGDVQLLLVAKDAETKQRWVAAMRAVLRQRS